MGLFSSNCRLPLFLMRRLLLGLSAVNYCALVCALLSLLLYSAGVCAAAAAALRAQPVALSHPIVLFHLKWTLLPDRNHSCATTIHLFVPSAPFPMEFST